MNDKPRKKHGRPFGNIEDSKIAQAILNCIIDFKEENDGNSPTFSEIAEETGAGKSTVYYWMRRLEEDKALKVLGVRQIIVNGGNWSMTGDDEDKIFA